MRDSGGPGRHCGPFTIPLIPPSLNSLLNVMWGLRRVELKPEVRLWKSKAKEYVPKFKVESQEKVNVHLAIHSPRWITKDGKIRKSDVTNREKAILDAICEKQGWDDSQVWDRRIRKVEDEEEKVVCFLEVV